MNNRERDIELKKVWWDRIRSLGFIIWKVHDWKGLQAVERYLDPFGQRDGRNR